MFISAENRLKMDTVIDMLYQYVLKDTMPINIDSLFALFDIDIIILPENATEFNKMFNDMFPILRKNKEKGYTLYLNENDDNYIKKAKGLAIYILIQLGLIDKLEDSITLYPKNTKDYINYLVSELLLPNSVFEFDMKDMGNEEILTKLCDKYDLPQNIIRCKIWNYVFYVFGRMSGKLNEIQESVDDIVKEIDVQNESISMMLNKIKEFKGNTDIE